MRDIHDFETRQHCFKAPLLLRKRSIRRSNISGGKRGRDIVVRMQNVYVGLPAFQVQAPDAFRSHPLGDLLASGRFEVKHTHNFALDSILAIIYTTRDCAKQLQRFAGLDEVNNPLLR